MIKVKIGWDALREEVRDSRLWQSLYTTVFNTAHFLMELLGIHQTTSTEQDNNQSHILHNHIPFICQVCFVPNKHNNDITSSLRSNIVNPLWGLLKRIKICGIKKTTDIKVHGNHRKH